MNKTILSIIFVIVAYLLIGNMDTSALVIPDEAIRLRVIPNSNDEYDQSIKLKVKEELQNSVADLLKDAEGIEEARNIIENNMSNLDKKISNLLKKEEYNLGYKINFGYNYFPSKEFMGVTYDEGYYESVVVTLGEGNGDNWWCVLFPPLCLLEAEESDEVEYKFFVKELLEKYL